MAPATRSPDGAATRTPGRLSQTLISLLMKRATIVAAEPLSHRFRLITLEGPELAGVAWTPGHKVQIAMGSAFVARTYTPIDWNASTGRTRILGYAHGHGPGSLWVRSVQPGDQCDIFGPRKSLDVRHLSGPLAIFGDESSIGLAHALSQADRTRSVTCHFEVDDVESGRRVVAHLGLGLDDVALVARRGDDAHLETIEAALPLVAADATFLLTGKAGSIQRLRQALKHLAVPASRLVTKAYWAPGKTGLD